MQELLLNVETFLRLVRTLHMGALLFYHPNYWRDK